MPKQEEQAKQFAYKAHKGMKRKGKELPFTYHLELVNKILKTLTVDDNILAAGWLHDVIEDTELTLEDLNKYDFSKEVLEAVDIITKKRGEDYQSYLNSVKKNKLARAVKLADLRHNSDLTRLIKVTEKDIKRKEKYQKAIDFLNS